jgi:hypothetical protein
MKKAAVGFRVHSGWAALVGVSLEKGAPIVLGRQRAQLVETFSYKYRQPYHTAKRLPFAAAAEFVLGVRTAAQSLATSALSKLQAHLKDRGYNLDRGALLLASGKSLPELEKILQSHALIHTAD